MIARHATEPAASVLRTLRTYAEAEDALAREARREAELRRQAPDRGSRIACSGA